MNAVRTGTSVQLLDLPCELLDDILRLALAVPFEHFDHPLPSPFARDEYTLWHVPSSTILQVCKLFRDIGLRHLYETVVLRSHRQVVALLKTLRQEVQAGSGKVEQKQKGLSTMIKKLRVEHTNNASVTTVLQMCGHATHLWVNIRTCDGLDKGLEGMKIAHITIWDVLLPGKLCPGWPSARSRNISAIRAMMACSTTLESVKYHRAWEPDTVILPLRPLPTRLDRDHSIFPRLEAMKSLVELRLVSDQYSIEDIRADLPGSLGKLTVAFDISDLDFSSHIYSYRFNLHFFDCERGVLESRNRTETTPLALLINWYTFGSEISNGAEFESVALVERRQSHSPDPQSLPKIKADYRAFTGFLRKNFLKLRRLKWVTERDPFREGTADVVASGLENCLPVLEFLDYRSHERLFLDTLCTMSLPRLVEVRLRISENRAGFEMFLWVHGYKLLKLEIGLHDHVRGLLSEFCTNLEVLTIRVYQTESVDLRNFEEVSIHKKLKRIHILHEGGTPKQIEEQLAFVVAFDPKPFTALEAIQLQCRWPSASRWNLENNFFVRLAEFIWDTRKIKALDESGQAWKS